MCIRDRVHIVDVSGSEGRDPKEDFRVINQELAKFNPVLAKRPMLVAGNKCDLGRTVDRTDRIGVLKTHSRNSETFG